MSNRKELLKFAGWLYDTDGHASNPDWVEDIVSAYLKHKESSEIGGLPPKEILEKIKILEQKMGLSCAGCGLQYGGDAWIETVIPDKVWNDIRPEGKPEGAGILCISCISKRLTQRGYKDVPVWLCGTEPLRVQAENRQMADFLKWFNGRFEKETTPLKIVEEYRKQRLTLT